jgi:hypothetical protein
MPFWSRIRPDYFTQGVADGKSAASHSITSLAAESEQVREQAIFAAAALSGKVSAEDARVYRSGWVEGYRISRALAKPSTGQ